MGDGVGGWATGSQSLSEIKQRPPAASLLRLRPEKGGMDPKAVTEGELVGVKGGTEARGTPFQVTCWLFPLQ